MRPLPPLVCVVLSGFLLVMAPAAFSPAQSAEVRIGDFRQFECRTQDGKRLKPRYGDVDGVFFQDVSTPWEVENCRTAVKRKIHWCTQNTDFGSNTRDREHAECLPVFERQAQACVSFFERELLKCGRGNDGTAPPALSASGSTSARDLASAPDPWSDEGSNGRGSVWDPPASVAEVRIGGYVFECVTADGKRLKPRYGDEDGVYLDVSTPWEVENCRTAVKRKIHWCTQNTDFGSNTRDREHAECLPVFERQAQACVSFFERELLKCGHGNDGAAPPALSASGSASARDLASAPDPWSDEGSNDGGSVWDPPATEEANSGSRTQTAARASPAPAAGDDGDADEDASSYGAALSEVLGDTPQREATQDDYTGALAALERRAAEARRAEEEARREAEREAAFEARRAEEEARREAALRAEERELQEMQEREAQRQRLAQLEEARRERDALMQRIADDFNKWAQQMSTTHQSPSGGTSAIPPSGLDSSSSGMSGGSDCAAVMRRANELYDQYKAAVQEVQRSLTNENVEAANAIAREFEALGTAHPGC